MLAEGHFQFFILIVSNKLLPGAALFPEVHPVHKM